MSFGKLIAVRRRELGLSQREVADRMCAASGRPTLTRNEVSRYERGLRIPSGPTLASMAASLDLPLSDLERAATTHRQSVRRCAASRSLSPRRV